MTKSKNHPKLNKVVLNNVDAVVVSVKPAANNDVPKEDLRHNNPGRPVNKQSARYKRLAKQARYARALSKFTQGSKFKLEKDQQTYQYIANRDEAFGCILNAITGHVCNIDYIGRTKVTGYTYVLNKRVNVEVNLKHVKFVK